MNWSNYLEGLLAVILLAVVVWIISLFKRDVSIVDSAWSLLFVGAMFMYIDEMTMREWLVFALVIIWALRLSAHITIRSWGEAEDLRYQAIRKKYSPGFALKSLFIIFIFQALLAWVLTLPLFAIFSNPAPIGMLTNVAIMLVLFGLSYESIADWQLERFKSIPENKGKVMDQGLWHYSRHPNYFGEAVVWWGFSLFAIEHGYWWAIISPIILTYLLLRFSGVSLMEETITERRPAYKNYILSTNAFLPGRKKSANTIDFEGRQL